MGKVSSPDNLAATLNDYWFHAIDFGGGLASKGRFPGDRPPNYTLFGVLRYLEKIDVTGKECLDIGTMDGIVAFTLKQNGAGRVVATDISPRETFRLGREHLNLDIEYSCPTRIDELAHKLGGSQFDLIVCAGVLYHVFEPLTSLILLRQRLKENGLLILETHYLYDQPEALISFSPSDARRGHIHPNTFFLPSFQAVSGMIEMAGFEIVSTMAVNSRLTVLARAQKPSKIAPAVEGIRRVLKSYMNEKYYNEKIDYNELEKGWEVSSIDCSAYSKGDYFICPSIFETRNPLQPKWNAPTRKKFLVYLSDLVFKVRTCLARRKYLPGAGSQA